jgi:hypothetical protein
LAVRRALIELAHEGYHAEIADGALATAAHLGNRVRLAVRDRIVTGVAVG